MKPGKATQPTTPRAPSQPAGTVYKLAPAAFETLCQVGAEIQDTRRDAERAAAAAQLAEGRGKAFLNAIAATLGIPAGSDLKLDMDARAIVVSPHS